MRKLLITFGLVVSLAGVRVVLAAPGSPGPLVSIPKGASQEQALKALHDATGLLVIAEPTQVAHRSETAIEDAASDSAIPAVTAVYQLHALAGRRRVLFVRRFRDPREILDLPIEELAAITTSLRDLVDPLSSHLDRTAPLHDTFYRSLTPQQIASAQMGQLRLADLSDRQRAAWAPLQANIVFDGQANDLRDFSALYSNFGNATLGWFPLTLPSGQFHDLLLRWPVGNEFQARTIYQDANGPAVPPAKLAPVSPEESTESLPEAGMPVTGCPADAGSFPQPVRLQELAARIGERNGVTIQMPKWAKDRECFLFADGHSGDEVLQSVAELNGWVIHSVGPQRFALQRPVFLPPVDYMDYYRKARALVPPAIRQLAHPMTARQTEPAWRSYYVPLLWERVLRATPDYKPESIRITDLGPEWQRRVANFLLAGRLLWELGPDVDGEPPKPWLVAPERCAFRLLGDPDPGKYPLLEFGGVDERGKWSGFGWIVNSHSALPHGE